MFGGHVEGASAIVYSTAVKADTPEMVAGRAQRLPLVAANEGARAAVDAALVHAGIA